MEELLVALLESRDLQAAERFDLTKLDDALSYLATTTTERGLTRLFVDMSVAAITPSHPAHRFMREHRADRGGRPNPAWTDCRRPARHDGGLGRRGTAVALAYRSVGGCCGPTAPASCTDRGP
ncbi:hypothetical protein B6N42_05150 [Cutibacterium avidum]|nr:hypothetical protein APY07_10210 [Cutibacterium avidum]OIJ77181.1 hypothetical protein APY08_10205 [Cutibacterium avidum]OIJ79710.1 hypothetical protein APY06_10185 [Cutibacterium avidum]PGX63024.1 hypothetical protein B6N40_04570 [Cutibacterium avidum]PGX65756.1 hypothetical protein B6N42_05150 [Cutibacterium avidum]